MTDHEVFTGHFQVSQSSISQVCEDSGLARGDHMEPRNPESILTLRDIHHEFYSRGKKTVAIEQVNLDIREREFLVLIGPSGCGKSTILNLITGIFAPTAGEILFRGKPLVSFHPSIGYITQQDHLFPWRTLRQNVELGLEVRKVPAKERRARAEAFLAQVGLQGFEDHYPHELSGGMRQRCNIVRTLIYDPEVILMDEPFGALDAITRNVLQNQLLELWSRFAKTVIFVTHDLTEAIALADRVAVMSARPGRIKLIEEIHLPRPRDVFEVQKLPEFHEIHDRLLRSVLEELRGGVFDYVAS